MCFLLPTTLIYIFMIILVISGLVNDIIDLDFEAVKIIVGGKCSFLLPGYGIYALWWLVLCTGLYLPPAYPSGFGAVLLLAACLLCFLILLNLLLRSCRHLFHTTTIGE